MTKQESLIGYKFTILSEDVATQDLFEDQTHERVSENLYQIIRDGSKGVTIGLEGSWGSGKSTVIKLLKDKLAKNNEEKNLFFMFDAWAHDGDPLRRIFLESLIREIDPREEDRDLKDIKGRITGRKKVVEIKAKKSTSRLGKFISLSALLIPLGSAFLGKVNYDLFVWPWANEAQTPYFLFLVGLLFCLSPLLVLAYWCRWGDKDPETKKTSWDFFSVDSKEDYTQDITEDGERTSIEFEDHFKCIIQTAMSKRLIAKCIIVVDNLDRVDPDHAKNIWSTLQTFFQKRSNGDSGGNWSDKLWFVIPFDREGFYKIWKANDSDEETGKSFLKKCFQLIAEVPHPVMSGWSRYAEKCIDEALNQWPEHERKNVLSTYVRYASRLDKSPTPRDIKVFANQVGLLGAMWGGQMSVEAICLYVLFKEVVTTNGLRESLIAGKLPNDYQTDSNLSDIYSELAGLLFGVNKQKGVQLLLGPEIQAAFNAGNGEALSTLVKDHENAFWIAYEASKHQWMITSGHVDEFKIAFTKAFHGGLMEHKNRLIRDIERLVDIWTSTFIKLDLAQFDYSASMNFTFELCADKSRFLESIHQLTAKTLSETIALVGNEKFPDKILENLRLLIGFLEDKKRPLKAYIYPNLNAGNWKIWLNHLKKYNLSYEMVFPNKETINTIAIESQFSSPNLNETALELLIKTYEIYPDSPEWELVTDQIISWLSISNRIYDCESLYELALKLSVNKNIKISSKITECVKGSSFWVGGQHSSISANPSLPVLVAISAKDELQKNSHVSPEIKSFWSAASDETLLANTFNLLKTLNKLDILWRLCRDEKNSTAANFIRNSNDQVLYSSWTGTNFIDEYDWASEEEIRNIAEKLAANDSFFNNECNMKEKAVTYQAVYKIFYALKNSKISAFIDTEISKVSKDDWKKCIENNGELLDLVKSKNPHFSEALNEYLIAVVSGDIPTGISSGLGTKLSSLLGKVTDLHKDFIPKVMQAYFSTDKDHLKDDGFNMLCPLFSQHLSRLDESSLMERTSLWIKSNAKERIQWLTAQSIESIKDPSEKLIALVELGLKSDDTTQNEIAAMINEKFNLDVVIPVRENHDNE
ncbi:MAG: hypothetical protein EOO53_01810 [Gammaproteobacteria bacterium]|nr:MAG: hypothetical protein EOO53_01810 [Gammaproteobacteria bacterium]